MGTEPAISWELPISRPARAGQPEAAASPVGDAGSCGAGTAAGGKVNEPAAIDMAGGDSVTFPSKIRTCACPPVAPQPGLPFIEL
mmetsp:Transcript_29268/g.93203  ORF Transcript_29268/g.93203 Transcript_29268/m.93203 type:complete len:85 (+) Transcript_29268:20-274(+)|eukprot:scaffold912_cov108-Isochrysis_galbana.AAC.14